MEQYSQTGRALTQAHTKNAPRETLPQTFAKQNCKFESARHTHIHLHACTCRSSMVKKIPLRRGLLSTHVIGPAWAMTRQRTAYRGPSSLVKSNQMDPCLRDEEKMWRKRSRIHSSRQSMAAKVKPMDKRASEKAKVTAQPG